MLLALTSVALGSGPGAPPGSQNKALIQKARQILKEVPLIDGHNDAPWQYRNRAGNHLEGIGLHSWRMVFDGRYKYVRGFEDQPLLFDLATDPGENVNLVEEMPEIARRLNRILDDESVGHGN